MIEDVELKSSFTKIPRQVTKDSKDLKKSGFLVRDAIFDKLHSWKKTYGRITNDVLREFTGLKDDAIRSGLKQVEDKGIILIFYTKNNDRFIFFNTPENRELVNDLKTGKKKIALSFLFVDTENQRAPRQEPGSPPTENGERADSGRGVKQATTEAINSFEETPKNNGIKEQLCLKEQTTEEELNLSEQGENLPSETLTPFLEVLENARQEENQGKDPVVVFFKNNNEQIEANKEMETIQDVLNNFEPVKEPEKEQPAAPEIKTNSDNELKNQIWADLRKYRGLSSLDAKQLVLDYDKSGQLNQLQENLTKLKILVLTLDEKGIDLKTSIERIQKHGFDTVNYLVNEYLPKQLAAGKVKGTESGYILGTLEKGFRIPEKAPEAPASLSDKNSLSEENKQILKSICSKLGMNDFEQPDYVIVKFKEYFSDLDESIEAIAKIKLDCYLNRVPWANKSEEESKKRFEIFKKDAQLWVNHLKLRISEILKILKLNISFDGTNREVMNQVITAIEGIK